MAESRSSILGGWEDKEGHKWGITKGQKKIGVDKYVFNLDCDYSFMHVFKCQNVSNSTL